MLSNPKNGWCNFDFVDFHETPSYITDVPLDVIEGCCDFILTHRAKIKFDCEGSDFALILEGDYNINSPNLCITTIFYKNKRENPRF